MADPVVWYTVNAQLDGVDTGSENLQDRMKFFIYQRRMLLEAIKNKAMFLAMMGNTEAAAKSATDYMEMAVPLTQDSKLEQEASLDAKMKEFSEMKPIPVVATPNGVRVLDRPSDLLPEGFGFPKKREVTPSLG